MRSNLNHVEQFRFSKAPYTSREGDRYGLFSIPFEGRNLLVVVAPDIFSTNELTEWEHISVSLKNRCPNWREMSYVKDLFWDEEDTVVQYHPKKSDYVNMMPTCLHLWKWNKGEIPTPHYLLVGFKNKEEESEVLT